MKAIILLLILGQLPYKAVKPKIEIRHDSVFVNFKTANFSTDPNVFYGEVPYPETPRPFFLDYDRNVWSKKVDTLHSLYLRDIKPGRLYHYQVSYIDTVRKVECASREYFFRIIHDGDGHLKEGVVITDGPYLSIFSTKDYGIFFWTNYESRAWVEIDNKKISDNTISRKHEIYLKDLQGGEKKYRVIVVSGVDTFYTPIYKFHVKENGSDLKFLVAGDSRASWRYPAASYRINGVNFDILRLLMLNAYRERVDFVVLLGDLISGVTQSREYGELQYRTYLNAMWPFDAFIPVLHVPGNHDMTAPYIKKGDIRLDPEPPNSAEDLWKEVFMLPENGPQAEEGKPPYKENVYYVDIGNARIVVLNVDYNYTRGKGGKLSPALDKTQLEWLKKVLKDNKKEHLFVCFHEPAYPLGPHIGSSLDARLNERRLIWNLLSRYSPDAVFVAHEHFYARMLTPGNIWQVITGRAGAPLYTTDVTKIPEDIKLFKFSKEFHYCLIETENNKSYLTTKTFTGDTLDSCKLR